MKNKEIIHTFSNKNSNYQNSHKSFGNRTENYILAYEGKLYATNNTLKLLLFSSKQLDNKLEIKKRIFLYGDEKNLFYLYDI